MSDSATAVLEELYPEDVCGLVTAFVSRLKNDFDRKAYIRAFVNFGEVTGTDPLHAGINEFSAYVSALMSQRADGKLKHSTVCKYYKIISSFLSYLVKMAGESELVPDTFENRLALFPVKPPKDVFYASRIPSYTSLDALIGWLRGNDMLTLIAVLFSLKCYLKSGDFIDLKTTNVCADGKGNCYVESPARNLISYIPEDFADILDSYFAANLSDGDYIFSSRRSGHLSIPAMDARLKKACEAIGESFTFNDIRNAAAVYSYTGGATEEQISSVMGYKTPAHIRRLSSLSIPADKAVSFVNIKVEV